MRYGGLRLVSVLTSSIYSDGDTYQTNSNVCKESKSILVETNTTVLGTKYNVILIFNLNR